MVSKLKDTEIALKKCLDDERMLTNRHQADQQVIYYLDDKVVTLEKTIASLEQTIENVRAERHEEATHFRHQVCVC